MIAFKNIDFKNFSHEESFFIFCSGYETRSLAILKECLSKKLIPINNVMAFVFNDYSSSDTGTSNYIYIKQNDVPYEVIKANQFHKILETIYKENSCGKVVSIDYSSMPRIIYLEIAQFAIQNKIRINFWYSEGNYSNDISHCSTSGINDFEIFSGAPSLKPNNTRTHIFNIGFNWRRSSALNILFDPERLYISIAGKSRDHNVVAAVLKANHDLDVSAKYKFILPVDDFTEMISRLNELCMQLRSDGDVILIPDGPKPAILAYSILPFLIDQNGVVCYTLVSSKSITKIDISATGKVYGVEMSHE